jgi:hypothetical protein
MKTVFLFFLVLSAAPVAHASGEGKSKTVARTISGMVYFTNNSPDVYEFPVELFDSKFRRVAAKRTENDSGHFEFKGLRPGLYYVQVLISNRCLLQYEVDARKEQPERLQVFGDAGCGHHQIVGLPAPRPVPRNKKR